MDSEIRLTIAPIEQIAVAMENARLNVQQILASFQASFDQAAAVSEVFVDVQENIRRSTERWFASHQAAVAEIAEEVSSSVARMADMMAAAAASFERYRNEEEPEACALLSRAGWLGMHRHFSIRQLRESVQLHKTEGEAAMNDAILEYFNENDAAPLDSMSQHWLSIPYLRDRENTIRDAVSAHKAGQFTLSIPALLPLGEGLAAEALGDISTRAVQKLAADWKARETEVWAQEFCNAVEQVIYKFYPFGKDPAPYLNRHGILHGRVTDYATAANSLRVFLYRRDCSTLARKAEGSRTSDDPVKPTRSLPAAICQFSGEITGQVFQSSRTWRRCIRCSLFRLHPKSSTVRRHPSRRTDRDGC